MHFDHHKVTIGIIIVLLIAFLAPTVGAYNIEKTYSIQSPTKLVTHQYSIINVEPRILSWFNNNQKLYVSIPTSIINYYGNLTHTVNDDNSYAKFVTPQAVAPIAESLRQVTENLPYSNEQFADSVLALVHQIPYNITDPKYPIETLAENTGDCVGTSLLAASIMEAGGLDVVLILYTGINPQHMNVGVYLPYTPVYHTPLETPTSFTYDNKTYWTAECTPAGNWRVGDQSLELANAEANIIPLNNTAQVLAPATVSAKLNNNLLPSTITINPSQQTTTETNEVRTLTISGSIKPAISDQIVNIYISNENNEAQNYDSTVTDNEGNYNLTWNFTASGTYYITASWNGASNYAGSDSQTLPVFVGPQSFVQFNAIDYNYIFGQPAMAAYATAPMQGINDFLSLPLGANSSLSYSFIILQAGQTISNVQTANVTVPASQQRVLTLNGTVKTIQVPAHNVTVPVSVPNGLEPLRLPDNFNQTLDNQFCFIVQNDNNKGYSFNIKGLSEEDLSNLQANAAIINATGKIKENEWYQITANITSNGATTDLKNANGTLIHNTTGNHTVLLIANNQDTAIVFKNITFQTQNGVSQQTSSTQKPASFNTNLNISEYITLVGILAVAISAVLYFRRMKKKSKAISYYAQSLESK